MAYCGYITRIKDIRKHNNADRLQVGTCFGNSVIVGLDTKEDDLILYFPTDGKLGIEYAETNNLLRKKDAEGNNIGGYLDPEKRNITSIKLRGEKSDGLVMSLETLSKFTNISKLKEGDTIDVLNGTLICEKYIPKAKNTINTSNDKNKKKVKTIEYPLFEEHVDTSQYAYNKQAFKEGDVCYITLKCHGSSQRMTRTLAEKKRKLPKIVCDVFGLPTVKKSWETVCGTRRVVLGDFNKGGFYGSNLWREKHFLNVKDKLHKGETIYCEIVGFMGENKPIMSDCDNRKTKDKDFIKQYGNTTRFSYGCEDGQSDMYVYRMTMTNEDGDVVEYPTELVKFRCEQMGIKFVPILDKFIFTTIEDLDNRVNTYIEGADPIGKTHIREGVVIRIDNREKFTAYKHKNFGFKCIEGIIKSDGILDVEEAESEGMTDGE